MIMLSEDGYVNLIYGGFLYNTREISLQSGTDASMTLHDVELMMSSESMSRKSGVLLECGVAYNRSHSAIEVPAIG